MRTHRWKAIGIALVVLGVLLRVYHRDQAMYFMNDQGLVMLVAHEILMSFHVPIAGPRISLDMNIPPLTYYMAAVFSYLRSDPLAVSAVYTCMNVIACIFLSLYGVLLFDVPTGVWALGLSLISMSMIESGRTIWEPHSTFWFVVLYLYTTELGYRKKNIWIYGIGIVMYCVGIALYPTPLLLVLYVVARTAIHMRSFDTQTGRNPNRYALAYIGGILLSVFLPWSIYSGSLASLFTKGMSISALPFVSSGRMMHTLYTYISNAFHDLFRIWILLPPWLIGSVWMKLAAIVCLSSVAYAAGRRHIHNALVYLGTRQYYWITIGFIVPSLVGMRMAPHRLLPFYPFFFIMFAWWIRWSLRSISRMSRVFAICTVCIYVVGNMVSWYVSTVSTPRNEYPRAIEATRLIQHDMQRRKVAIHDVGVHYFRPDDQADYFGSFMYYLLHISIQYPVSFLPLGNSLARHSEEKHGVVYLLCDGFIESSKISGCIRPYASKWPAYTPVQSYRISDTETLVVFIHSPS
jgi:hypothetical protein